MRYQAGELVDTITTEGGTATSKPLYLGTYTVTEKTAPEGYVQDTTVYDVTLFHGNQTIELVTEGISIDNAPQMGFITITKRDKETGKPIILSDAVFQLHAKEDIVTGDGVVHYRAGELVDTVTTVQGVIASKPLYLGTYVITEITAPDGYILDSTPHDVTLTYGGQSIELVSENLSLDNAPQMGTITITKVDSETGKPIILSPATFEIYAAANITTPDGTVRYTKGQLVDTIQTKDGVATSKLLYLGDYIVIETIAPEGYILDTTHYEAALLYDGQVATAKRMAMTGPVLDMELPDGQNGQEQPGTTVPDTDNNANIIIPNRPIPETPKTGDALPAQALTITVCSMTALLLLHRRKKHNR